MTWQHPESNWGVSLTHHRLPPSFALCLRADRGCPRKSQMISNLTSIMLRLVAHVAYRQLAMSVRRVFFASSFLLAPFAPCAMKKALRFARITC